MSRGFMEVSLRRHDWLIHCPCDWIQLQQHPPHPRYWAHIMWSKKPTTNNFNSIHYQVWSEGPMMNNRHLGNAKSLEVSQGQWLDLSLGDTEFLITHTRSIWEQLTSLLCWVLQSMNMVCCSIYLSLISFITVLHFSAYKACTCFVIFTAKIFIWGSYCVMFLIFVFNHSLLIYRQTIIFYMFTLYSVTLLITSFTSSSSFIIDFVGFLHR